MLGMAEPADQRHDVEAELVIRQCEVGLGLGPVGPEEAGAGGIGAAPDRQRQPDDAIEGRDAGSCCSRHRSGAGIRGSRREGARVRRSGCGRGRRMSHGMGLLGEILTPLLVLGPS